MTNLKLFFSIINEFLRTLVKANTYNVWRNGYVVFGILWGIPVPIVTIGLSLYCSSIEPSITSVINEIIIHPFQIFFLLHPLIFGVVFGAMGTIREEKERQKIEFEESLIRKNKELEDVNKKLKELDSLKDNFLSMVSHELKTPLTTIQGYITFVKSGKAGNLSEEQVEALGVADEQADHLNDLISELMDLSRIESGRFQVELEPTNLVEVANKVITSLSQAFSKKDVMLEKVFPESALQVLADPKRISQVFMNLLENALKFTPPKGKVIVLLEGEKDTLQCSVQDTGIGIPQNEIDKIFNKFYQVDSTTKRKYGGCGLGLAIAKHIVELHKGRMWATSEPGKGSKFCFELRK